MIPRPVVQCRDPVVRNADNPHRSLQPPPSDSAAVRALPTNHQQYHAVCTFRQNGPAILPLPAVESTGSRGSAYPHIFPSSLAQHVHS